jgi:23S rRNA (cytosine1962-C5)-methyltransferase
MGRMSYAPPQRAESSRSSAPTAAAAGTSIPSVKLRGDLEASLAKGHPWIYRDHLPAGTAFAPGTWVRIQCNAFTGIGVFDPGSPLAIRVYTRSQVPDAAWFETQVARARQRRQPLLADGSTNAYRLINGEGDGLPGIVVDVYGQFAAVRLDSAALTGVLPWVVSAVQGAIEVKGVVQKSNQGLEVLAGRAPPERLIVSEHGLRFFADIGSGQKTGLFLDHRENRGHVEKWCSGARVLNLFAYTGGFSLYAARGGASQVLSVDRAGDALSRARENVELNGLDPNIFEFITDDAMKSLEQLAQSERSFDVVISDPPSFARNRTQRSRAIRAYEKLHALALAVLAPGGLYAAASCTSQVDVQSFKDSIARAAALCHRPLQIVMENGHALDHPVMIGHPEGRYLKFVALRSTSD